MQIFVKTFLIVLITEIIEAELKICESENLECKLEQTKFSDSETTGLNDLVRHTIKCLSDLNQRYDNKINTIVNDINSLKGSFHTGGQHHTNCSYSPQELSSKTPEVEVKVETPPTLYDKLWVIIQRRQEGAVSFYRSWVHYVVGFGNPLREFFIGLDKIHYLTSSRPHELLIKLEDFKGKVKYALYDEFLIGSERERYQLKKLGNYSGNAGDYLRPHEGMYFSTRDRDNDASNNLHCAKVYQGGWWYHNCMTSNLNGPFRMRYEINNFNMTWGNNNETQFKIVQMMIRSK